MRNFFQGLMTRTLLGLVVCLGCAMSAQAGHLYVLNDNTAGSQIYGYSVNESTGALTLLGGFPMPTGGNGGAGLVSERMVIDRRNHRLYVINDNSDSVSAFSINPLTGALTALPFSPIALGSGTWNTINVHPSGSPLIVGAGTLVASYNITPTTATPAAGSPYVMSPASAFSSAFTQDGNYVYVGGNMNTTFGGFSVNAATGVLTALAGSPFDAGAANPIGYATDAAGRLFTVSAAVDLRVFTLSGGIPTPVSGNPFPPAGLTQRRDGLIHPGGFYMVAGNSGDNVGVFKINGSGAATTLTAVTGSPFATGGNTANALALNRTGSYLYVANRITRNLTTFLVNHSTGQLTSLGVQASNTLGTTGSPNGMAYYSPATGTSADFDGDSRTDISVFRGGTWHTRHSSLGYTGGVEFGLASDEIAPGDYDGDGKTDIAVFRAGTWYVLRSLDGAIASLALGAAGDQPMTGDYDGDGKADAAVYRPSDNTFYVLRSSDGGTVSQAWGTAGDVPLAGDFDGDGRTDYGVYRAGVWHLLQTTAGYSATTFGLGTDSPVPADYDADGRTDLGVFRDGAWYLRQSTLGFSALQWGAAGDIPVPGDYDGGANADRAVFRPGTNTWHILSTETGVILSTAFGTSGDTPVPAAYVP